MTLNKSYVRGFGVLGLLSIFFVTYWHVSKYTHGRFTLKRTSSWQQVVDLFDSVLQSELASVVIVVIVIEISKCIFIKYFLPWCITPSISTAAVSAAISKAIPIVW